jgi:hypothetical protein
LYQMNPPTRPGARGAGMLVIARRGSATDSRRVNGIPAKELESTPPINTDPCKRRVAPLARAGYVARSASP